MKTKTKKKKTISKKPAKKVLVKSKAKKPVKKAAPKKEKKDTVDPVVRKIYEICDDMKATDIVVLDMMGASSFTDYVIIASSSNTRQVVAIAEKINVEIKKEFGQYAIGTEGKVGGQWVLIDYGSVVCHLFLEETREFYRLEKLWHDAKVLKL